MKKARIYLYVTAVLLIALGVVCIANPDASFLSTAWLMGLLVLLGGITSMVMGLTTGRLLPNAGLTTLTGLMQIILGIMLLGNGMLASGTLIVVFVMWVMFEGVSLAVNAIDYKRFGFSGWWVMLLLGVCAVVLGFFALRNPEATASTIGLLVGIAIVANGMVRLVAAYAMKKIGNRIRDLKESATAMPID